MKKSPFLFFFFSSIFHKKLALSVEWIGFMRKIKLKNILLFMVLVSRPLLVLGDDEICSWSNTNSAGYFSSLTSAVADVCAQNEAMLSQPSSCVIKMETCGLGGVTYSNADSWKEMHTIITTASKTCDGVPDLGIEWRHQAAFGFPCKYVAIALNVIPRPQQCVANPIDVGTGNKIQTETIIPALAKDGISFSLFYNSYNTEAPWVHNYQRQLKSTKQQLQYSWVESSQYVSKSNACISGFAELKTNMSAAWTKNSIAVWNEAAETCDIKKNNVLVQRLLIRKYPSALVETTPELLVLARENGNQVVFAENAAGYLAFGENIPPITNVGTGLEPIWQHRQSSGGVNRYNRYGQLISTISANNVKQEFFYDAISGLLLRAKDSYGRELLFNYTNSRLSSVTVDSKTTSFSYDTTGMLSAIIHPDSSVRQYHYEDIRFPTALTGITDERNKRYATWAYDAQGRAISSEHAGGVDKTLLNFNLDGSTTVTNVLNKKTIYRFDDVAGVRRVIEVEGQPTEYCAGANQTYAYTNEGLLESKTDWKGIQTKYQYNGLGQETSRTEAFGTPEARTIRTEWHPTLYLKTKITEPGKETTFSYDANGRLLNQSTQAVNN